MSQYQKFLQDTVRLKYDAATKRPDAPRFGDELALHKSMADMQEKYSKPDREATNEMLTEISERDKKNGGGSAGDALISGLKAGIKKGSFMDDKNRLKGIMDFTEKMQGMVSAQNQQLFQEEKRFNAKEAVSPRIYGYLDSYQGMSPSDRKVYLDNVLKEYNSIAGTNYDLLDIGGADPLKVLVDTGNGADYIDLMDMVKTAPEKKLDIILKSQEYQQAQKAAMAQDSRANRYGGSSGNSAQNIITTPDGEQIDVSHYPEIIDAKQRNMYSNTYTGMSKILRELEDTYREVDELEFMTKDNKILPFGSQIGQTPNAIKDWIAKNPGTGSELKKEVELRNRIESRFQQIQPILERYLKGSAPDAQLLKRMHEQGVYPEPNQSFDVIKSKLGMLINTAKEDRDIAGLSLNAKKQIPFLPKSGMHAQEQRQNGYQQNTENSMQTIRLQSPNGVIRTMPNTPENQKMMQKALQSGYRVLGNE